MGTFPFCNETWKPLYLGMQETYFIMNWTYFIMKATDERSLDDAMRKRNRELLRFCV